MSDAMAEGLWEFIQVVEECGGDGVVVGVDWDGKTDVRGAFVDSSVTAFVWGGVGGGLGVREEVFGFVVVNIV